MSQNIEICCPCCGSKKISFVSRIVGYYSVVKNWSNSKVQELKARESGDYSLTEKESIKESK